MQEVSGSIPLGSTICFFYLTARTTAGMTG